jgi:hypothetical protein
MSVPKAPLQISVVDSSFNPPHAAHLALALHGQHDAHLFEILRDGAHHFESSRDGVFIDAALVGVGNGEREHPHIVHFGRVYARLRFTRTLAVAETVAWRAPKGTVAVQGESEVCRVRWIEGRVDD